MSVVAMAADGGSGAALKSNTLLIDKEIYQTKQKRMLEAEDKLVLNTSAFGMENEVCGTNSVDILDDYWHRTEKTDIKFHDFTCNSLDALLSKILLSMNNSEDTTSKALEFEENKEKSHLEYEQEVAGCSSKDGESELFDDDGSYGGSQHGPENEAKKKEDFWDKLFGELRELFGGDKYFSDKEKLFAFIRSYPGYENYTDEQIMALLDQLTNEGCGYTAAINAILAAYEGKPEEFEKIFGFPLYDENGELNYNRLLLDIYLETNDKHYLGDDDLYGEYALYYDILFEYKEEGREEDFKKDFGVDLYIIDPETGEKKVNPEAYDAIDEFINNISGDEYTFEHSGLTTYGLMNTLDHYLREKGVDSDIVRQSSMTNDEIVQALDEGKTIVTLQDDFELYYEDGTEYQKEGTIGGHFVVITGVTEDGDYIVSSWGKRFILKKSDFDKIVSYTVIDVEVEDN